MKLVIVSHTEHYLRDGRIVGWGATVREIDHLAVLFDEVVHIAPLHEGNAPESAIAYQAANVSLRAVKPAGGNRLGDKLSILMVYPQYIRAMLQELRQADVAHVRCPANISLLAVILLTLVRYPQKRWIKYAGNWHPDGRESWSYTFQRWWLKRGWHRGHVTVNGKWEGDPPFIHSFLNPCLTDEEYQSAKLLAVNKQLTQPVHLLIVGRVESAKGVGRALEICARLKHRDIQVVLDLVGGGPERSAFERQAQELGVEANFHGWLPRTALGEYYARAHFLIFPTNSEGWPKVISEAMAYGVVPLAGAVSSIPQYLKQFGVGAAHPPADLDAFVNALCGYLKDPSRWQEESHRAAEAAEKFTYTRYLEAVQQLLNLSGVR